MQRIARKIKCRKDELVDLIKRQKMKTMNYFNAFWNDPLKTCMNHKSRIDEFT